MGNIRHTEFQQMLYNIFVHEKKYPVDTVARMSGIEQSTFYSYTGGHNYFPPDLIPVLYNATVLFDAHHKRKPEGEMRIWTFLMQDTGLEAVRVDRGEDPDPLQKDLLDIHEGAGGLTALVREAVEDGRITEMEAENISNKVSTLVRELEGIRAKTKPTGKKR